MPVNFKTSYGGMKQNLDVLRQTTGSLQDAIFIRNRDKLLRKIKYELAAARFEVSLIRFDHACRKAGFNPNEPRVPAGNPDGGQWTTEGGNASYTTVGTAAHTVSAAGTTQLSAAGRKRSAAWCWNQMQIDMLYCSSLLPVWRVAACRAQANERYAACLTGKPLPPLPF